MFSSKFNVGWSSFEKIGAVAVKLASNAALFASTVRNNHAPTPIHNKT
jgi:hypothetical protein